MAGRPTNWSEELEEQAWNYVNKGWETEGHAVPSLVGLCSIINRSRTCIYDWAKQPDKQFSDILKAINEKQEMTALNQGLFGNYNSNIVKLLLGKHGYHDKQDVSADINDTGLSDTDRAARIASILDAARTRRDGQSSPDNANMESPTRPSD